MNYIIFDLEATCWEERDKHESETVEIGAVKINDHGITISEFSTFIKPLKHPHLSDFCKKLTSITQENIDSAPTFPKAIENFKSWIETSKEDYRLCSWGFYDRKQFEKDLQNFNLDSAWLNKHISLKHQHAKINNLKRPLGMSGALQVDGLVLEGTHHRGIDDARNISKIFIKYLGHWKL